MNNKQVEKYITALNNIIKRDNRFKILNSIDISYDYIDFYRGYRNNCPELITVQLNARFSNNEILRGTFILNFNNIALSTIELLDDILGYACHEYSKSIANMIDKEMYFNEIDNSIKHSVKDKRSVLLWKDMKDLKFNVL